MKRKKAKYNRKIRKRAASKSKEIGHKNEDKKEMDDEDDNLVVNIDNMENGPFEKSNEILNTWLFKDNTMPVNLATNSRTKQSKWNCELSKPIFISVRK